MKAVALAFPEGEVDVRPVAGVLRPRLRSQRRDESLACSDSPDRLPDEELLVGGLKRRRVPGRDLLLTVAELRVVLLELDPLALQSVHERIHVRL